MVSISSCGSICRFLNSEGLQLVQELLKAILLNDGLWIAKGAFSITANVLELLYAKCKPISLRAMMCRDDFKLLQLNQASPCVLGNSFPILPTELL